MGNLQPSRRLRFTVRNGARPINSQCDRSRSSDSAALAAVVGQGRGRAAACAPAAPSSGWVPLVGSPASPAAPAAAARASNGGRNGQHEPHALGTLLPGEPRESRLRGGWSGVWAAEVALAGALWLGDVPRPRRTSRAAVGVVWRPELTRFTKCNCGPPPHAYPVVHMTLTAGRRLPTKPQTPPQWFWQAMLPSLPYGGSLNLSVSSAKGAAAGCSPNVVTDVTVGQVYLCSGRE